MPVQRRNRFVEFVSDEHFLECVKWVCDAYQQSLGTVDMERLQRNAIDPFKTVFDTFNGEIDIEAWLKTESMRQSDKTINNKVGDFHQKLLGGVNGWENLGRGNSLGIDLKNDSNTIFMELKNKHNTVKGEDLKNVFDKLKRVADRRRRATVYYAYIIPKRPGGGERVWETAQRRPHHRIKEAWGFRVYEIVTGDRTALEKTWKALPRAIQEVTNSSFVLSANDKEKLLELFRTTFQ